MKKLFLLFSWPLLMVSCGQYQKALKSEDMAVKYEAAVQKYEAKKYSKAIRLFEQMAPAFRGKPQSEKMFYMYAQSYYKTEQCYLAGYQFESFVSSYPKSEKVEEAAFLEGLCFSKLSPTYSLDQADTYKAINKLQSFIDTYPNSTYLPEANATLKKLTDKIEKKYFEIAKQYNTISDYKSALVVLDNFVSDFPGTKYKEEALFLKLDSAYKLAINSIPSKMEERFKNAKMAYTGLMKFKDNTEYKVKADQMLARIEEELKKYEK
ncbi:outer membrane protein assembly factor BamD [Flavobacterium sp. CYK-55]|uniref:outer membrane protein assembly factor BamD n=1 Tax=Flavobacterium sp. CYK-55 TaxID=2835529 RepID=UPI001BCC6955|nr:outer membrane protein assembly factor BamD [Flavobacterium sp. CYK-55]MBS7786726.1 outer membrane protein assembly factor BamD [Flavobacterium sp. CYK-55]